MTELDPALFALGKQRAVEAILRTLLDMHLNSITEDEARAAKKLAVLRTVQKSMFDEVAFDPTDDAGSVRKGAEEAVEDVFGDIARPDPD